MSEKRRLSKEPSSVESEKCLQKKDGFDYGEGMNTRSALFGLFGLACFAPGSYATSATWHLSPPTSSFDTALNWTPNTVPNQPADTATFDVSNTTTVNLTSADNVGTIAFNPDASPYTIVAPLGDLILGAKISTAGVVNNSGVTQNFLIPQGVGEGTLGSLIFTNGASAGDNTVYTVNGSSNSDFYGGQIQFLDTSSAGTATIVINKQTSSNNAQASVYFYGSSTAGNATILNSGFVGVGATAGCGNASITNVATTSANDKTPVIFLGVNRPGSAILTTNSGAVSGAPGGLLQIFNFASTYSDTLIANGGPGGAAQILFVAATGTPSGGTSRVEVFGNARLDISNGNPAGTTIGSLEGDGSAFAGGYVLTIGSNNLSTSFSGVIQDGGNHGGSGAAVAKIGKGILTLDGNNTYTGGTTVTAGTLAIANSTGSGTGSGAVEVNSGTLGGSGIIAGAVTIGTGSSSGAVLAPAIGSKTPATLTLQSAVTFKSDAIYTYTFKAKNRRSLSDQVVANSIAIESGAIFLLSGKTRGTLSPGLTLTVLSNASATPISGTFSNLPNGGIVSVNGNNFQTNYQGGDGNDLTLTVVP